MISSAPRPLAAAATERPTNPSGARPPKPRYAAIARGVVLDSGDNDLEAVALDKAGNETTYPVSPAEHEITRADASHF